MCVAGLNKMDRLLVLALPQRDLPVCHVAAGRPPLFLPPPPLPPLFILQRGTKKDHG